MQKKATIFTFIGMSGVGKSYWSEKFRQAGYKIYPIDDLINLEVGNLINEVEGDENVAYEDTKVGGLAKWMGFPGDKRYKKNANKYLKLESKITLDSLKSAIKNKERAIIDTTGSVIYTNKKVQRELKSKSKIVFLETTEKNLKEMFKVFCAVPKPIIWGDIYKAKKGESDDQTLQRCYKELLDYRVRNYRKLAHTSLPYNFTHKKGLTLEKFKSKII